MGTHVVQCLDCGVWNWEGVTECVSCGSTNLTIGFHQLLAHLCSVDLEFKKKIDKIYEHKERR
jgi:hypothetical protein